MPDHDDQGRRWFAEYMRTQRPQSEYVIHYPARPSFEESVTIVLQLTLAQFYEVPIYFLVHHTANLPAGFRHSATAIESYGSDGDTKESATARLLRRIERDRLDHRS